jgi:hypothetical protein
MFVSPYCQIETSLTVERQRIDHIFRAASPNPNERIASGERPSNTKTFLKKLKEENEQRKEKVQHVSYEEAERMTGYGDNTRKDRDGSEKKNKDLSLGALLF